MATCKDCIHFDVCDAIKEERGIPMPIPKYCKCFKDKADVVEVVRCKDCKHRNPNGYKCLRDNLWHDTDDFCSYGKRKEQRDVR